MISTLSRFPFKKLALPLLLAIVANSILLFAFPVLTWLNKVSQNQNKEITKTTQVSQLNLNQPPPKKKKIIKTTQPKESRPQKSAEKSRFKLNLSAGGGQGAALDDGNLKNRVYEEGDADVDPILLNSDAIKIPNAVRAAGIKGVIVIEMTIDEYGRVRDLLLVESIDGYDFNETLASARYLRYKPAYKEGIPIAIKCTLPIRF